MQNKKHGTGAPRPMDARTCVHPRFVIVVLVWGPSRAAAPSPVGLKFCLLVSELVCVGYGDILFAPVIHKSLN